MRRFNDPLKDFGYVLYRSISPLFDPRRFALAIPRYMGFFRDLWRYSRLEGSEQISLSDLYPILHHKTTVTPFDKHYFYQDIWAFQRIIEKSPPYHIDIGSRVDLVGFLTCVIKKVVFVDIRPFLAYLPRLVQVQGSILQLPFADGAVISLSCLHVAEHIGLGRYGDPLDPHGTQKACRELARVLHPHGDLYFSVPVGVPRVCFNAHRIHSPRQILRFFEGLDLIEFSGVDDRGQFMRHRDLSALEQQYYACGFFHFRKPDRHAV
jgi:SAM-dependent methyltransferase